MPKGGPFELACGIVVGNEVKVCMRFSNRRFGADKGFPN